jgi:iron complex outermembrane receptor protein
MKRISSGLDRGLSLFAVAAALAITTPVHAQDQEAAAAPADAAAAEEAPAEEAIVVTGSRIARSGFNTPTPVTVVGSERLQLLGVTNVADGLNQLPSFRASGSPSNVQAAGGNVGARILDLRALGAPRTLVLVDGRRFVPSTGEGTVDINLIPSGLVQRTEVVTGGASAVYGSDAVAGVVNFILDRKFQGLKVELQSGFSQRADDVNWFGSVTGGFKIGDRGHFVIAGEYEDNSGLGGCYEARDWCAQERSIVGNTPAGTRGQPSSIITSDVHVSTMSPTGLINRSLNAAGQAIGTVANDPLRGTTFTNSGQPTKFNYGDFAGPLFMIGGDGHGFNPFLSSLLLKVPVERQSVYGALSYELADTVDAYIDVSYGKVVGKTQSSTFRDFNGSIIGNIKIDNPFIPASVLTTMQQNGIAQLQLGRSGFDFGSPVLIARTETFRIVTGLKGQLAGGWNWDLYYQYGKTNYRGDTYNNPINARMRNAVDAVQVGNSIVCRINADVSTANDDPACAPLNLFGSGQWSEAARNYVTGSGFQRTVNTQHVVAANISGDLFSITSRPVAISVGGEYRHNKIAGQTDAISQNLGFWVLNGQAVAGTQSVKEAYGELVVPLLADMSFVENLEVNGAFRVTDYSDSGQVETWKVGATYEPVPGIRFRVTQSKDIRAPNLTELRGPQQKSTIGLTDPVTGLQANPVVIRGSNPNLRPEKADSFTAGIIIAPRTGGALGRMRLSVDYYNIQVKEAIGQLGAQTLVQRCKDGATEFCPLITRDANNNVIQVNDVLVNANQLKTRGIDVEFDYRQPIGNLGDLNLRVLSTIYMDLITIDSAGAQERAGQTGSRAGTLLGVPDYTIDGTLAWTKGPLTIAGQGRYIPSGGFNVAFIGPDDSRYAVTLPTSVNNNRVQGRYYLNLSATYRISLREGQDLELFGAINNVFDRDPPAIPSGNLGTNQVLFDPIGRAFKIGARIKL